MGDMCASGGYYIASAADQIFALPATITGSVGVVMMSLSLNELLTEKLNINWDESIHWGKNSNMFNPFEYPNERLQEKFGCIIDHLYDLFKNRVATGRNMSIERVGQLAQGKVYTGQQAVTEGLVDDLGGLAE